MENQEFFPFSKEPEVQREFRHYLDENRNKKHISAERKYSLIRWLCDDEAKPQSQSDYSLRNYATKTYKWDDDNHILWSIGKSEKPEKPAKNGKGKKSWGRKVSRSAKCQDRAVVTEDEILNVVEQIHMSNDHGGWDATWDEVSTKYCGIVRSDVIFLLKRCYICTIKPRKQSRRNATPDESPASSSSRPGPSSEQQTSQEPLQFYEQHAPEQQDFDQILDQHSQETFDYNFGADFGSDSFQTDSFAYSSFGSMNQLWNAEIPDAGQMPDFNHLDVNHPDVGHPDVDMTSMDNIDPALLSNDFQNMSFSDFTYTYPFPEAASGSDTYPYNLDFMPDSV
ncbi:hypothetical protein ACHAPX_003264 [Trichoderma viride]